MLPPRSHGFDAGFSKLKFRNLQTKRKSLNLRNKKPTLLINNTSAQMLSSGNLNFRLYFLSNYLLCLYLYQTYEKFCAIC